MVERMLELRKRTPETPQERATARREIEPSADRARAGFFSHEIRAISKCWRIDYYHRVCVRSVDRYAACMFEIRL